MHTTDKPDDRPLDPNSDDVQRALAVAMEKPVERIVLPARFYTNGDPERDTRMTNVDIRCAVDQLSSNGRGVLSPAPERDDIEQAHLELRAATTGLAETLGTDVVRVPNGRDPEMLDPLTVSRVVARIGKRTLFDGPVSDAAGEMLARVAHHGRRLRVTCWMVDGSKRIYRGNGVRIR